MQVRTALGDDVNQDEADALVQVTRALDREGPAGLAAVRPGQSQARGRGMTWLTGRRSIGGTWTWCPDMSLLRREREAMAPGRLESPARANHDSV